MKYCFGDKMFTDDLAKQKFITKMQALWYKCKLWYESISVSTQTFSILQEMKQKTAMQKFYHFLLEIWYFFNTISRFDNSVIG